MGKEKRKKRRGMGLIRLNIGRACTHGTPQTNFVSFTSEGKGGKGKRRGEHESEKRT
jgi:hypothetical protein